MGTFPTGLLRETRSGPRLGPVERVRQIYYRDEEPFSAPNNNDDGDIALQGMCYPPPGMGYSITGGNVVPEGASPYFALLTHAQVSIGPAVNWADFDTIRNNTEANWQARFSLGVAASIDEALKWNDTHGQPATNKPFQFRNFLGAVNSWKGPDDPNPSDIWWLIDTVFPRPLVGRSSLVSYPTVPGYDGQFSGASFINSPGGSNGAFGASDGGGIFGQRSSFWAASVPGSGNANNYSATTLIHLLGKQGMPEKLSSTILLSGEETLVHLYGPMTEQYPANASEKRPGRTCILVRFEWLYSRTYADLIPYIT